MKRKLLALSVTVICAAIAVMGTLAFYTSEGKAHNVITTGGVNIQVIEQMDNGGALVDFPEEGVSGVMPGQAVSKIVQVKNTGVADAWIRVKAQVEVIGANGRELPIDPVYFTVENGWTSTPDAEGWYYYNSAVAAGEQTDAFIKNIDFAANMGNEYQNCTVNVNISAQAVQVANNGATAVEAVGWPSENP